MLYVILGIHLVIGTNAIITIHWLLFAFLTLGTLVCMLLVRIGIVLWRFRTERPRRSRTMEFVFIVLAFLVIHTTYLGVKARLWLSESPLKKAVERAQLMPQESVPVGFRCGLFKFWSAFKKELPQNNGYEPAVWLETGLGGRFCGPQCLSGGLVYCERGKPPNLAESHYEHLYGSWWLWLEDM